MAKRDRRSTAGWVAAIAWRRLASVALLSLLLAVAVGAFTVAQLTQTAVPQIALSIDPHNARANARLAELIFARDQQRADPNAMLHLSRDSLDRQAFNAEALRTTALGYALQDNVAKARAAFRLAGALSKRDAPTNLWLIEDAVQRDSVPDALALFDRSLRVDDNLQPVLFPVLAQALSDQVIAKAAIPIFNARPIWARDFVKYAMGEGMAAPALAHMVLAKRSNGSLLEANEMHKLVAKLARDGDIALADRLYRRFGPASESGLINDPEFHDKQIWPPFDWERSRKNNVTIFAADQKGGIEFTVTGAADSLIARQLILLKPGRYRVKSLGRLTDAEPGQLDLSLEILCVAGGGQTLLRSEYFGGAKGSIDAGFSVPAGCGHQWVRINASGERKPHSAIVNYLRIARG